MKESEKNIVGAILWCAFLAAVAFLFAGCDQNASRVASQNLSRAADQFEINRRVVFMNGITDNYMLEIVGRCSITDQGNQLEVTCRTSPEGYKKHFLGLSDNVTYFVEQLDDVDVSIYRYRVVFRPSTIVPNIDLDAGWTDG